jgi:hypothetical protein
VAGAKSYTLDRPIKNLVLQQHAVGILTARPLQDAKIIFLELKSGASWSWLVVHDRFGVRDRAALAGVRCRVWLTG